MSLTPKDMDFLEAKNGAARETRCYWCCARDAMLLMLWTALQQPISLNAAD